MEDDEALVFGIGNPGRDYEGTRHNVGFDVVRELSRRWGVSLSESAGRFESRWGRGTRQGRRVWLVEPITYVNLCGRALRAFIDFFKLPDEALIIVCDDVALPLGRLRMRTSGSSGGHNGLRSVEAVLGHDGYCRLRVGVGQPVRGMVDHVLGRFREDERELADKVVRLAADAVDRWFEGGPRAAMNAFNGINLAAPARPDPEGGGPEGGESPEAPGAKGREENG